MGCFVRLIQLSTVGEVFLERQLFEGGANKTAPPCVPFVVS